MTYFEVGKSICVLWEYLHSRIDRMSGYILLVYDYREFYVQ